jgi:hypothetical protein
MCPAFLLRAQAKTEAEQSPEKPINEKSPAYGAFKVTKTDFLERNVVVKTVVIRRRLLRC